MINLRDPILLLAFFFAAIHFNFCSVDGLDVACPTVASGGGDIRFWMLD
jgi:hypothetical protein